MTGLEAALLAWGVLCLAFLIVALGVIDDLRAELRRERAERAVQLTVFHTSLASGHDPAEVARRLSRALHQPTKGPST